MGNADTLPSGEIQVDSSRTIPERAPTENAPVATAAERGQQIGRFVVLDVLGTGGMGVVYAAYDPNLDRKVAIKVLRNRAMASNEARLRLLREAQAMARIDHPNVLRVHEAGTVDDQIYIAMEFASGGTLRQWLAAAPRDRDDIVRVFVDAGRGLAAAHAAGLVHRDFKPDNVLLVGSGQARVTDFGLVGVVGEQQAAPIGHIDATLSQNTPLSRDLTRTGALMGTPAYMSPEQFSGGTVGPAADQFSFCVALYEALYRSRPFAGATFPELCAAVLAGAVEPAPKDSDVPARIRRALLRGLATDPGARCASMDKLLGELAPAPGKRKRAVWIAASAGVVAAGALGVFVMTRRDAAVCSGAGERVATAWGPAQQQKLAGAFAAAHRPDARMVLDRMVPIVDGWSHSWQDAYVGACEDTRVRKVQSEHLLDLRMDCLARDLDETRAVLDALAAGGGDAVDHALDAVRELPSIAACSDTAALETGIAPPATPSARVAAAAIRGKLDQAHAQHRLAHYAAAMTLARSALDDARAAKYDPLIAEALLEVGRLQAALADPKAADTLAEAMLDATAAGDTQTAIRAAARRLGLMAHQPAKFPVADELDKLVTAAAAHASLAPATRVDLDNAAGALLQKERRYDEAQARYDHALQLATTQLPPDAPDTIQTLQGMGTLAAERHKYDDAKKLFEQVVAAKERVFGKEHPDYANALDDLANAMAQLGKIADTKPLREQSLAIRLAALGPDHPDVAVAYEHLGLYYGKLGDYPTAKTNFDKALAIEHKAYGDEGVDQTPLLISYGALLSDMGDRDGARAVLEKARALLEKAYGPDDYRVQHVLSNLGLVAKAQRRYDDAIALFEKCYAIAEKAYGPNDGDTLDSLGNLAAAYVEAARIPEARERMSKLLVLMAEVNGPDSLRMGLSLGNYGFLLLKIPDLPGALDAFQKAHAIFVAKLGKSHPNTAFVEIGMAQALIRMKRPTEALPLLETALATGNASHIAPGQLAEMHFYIGDALIANPKTRARARAEVTTAVELYTQGHDEKNAAIMKRWLLKH